MADSEAVQSLRLLGSFRPIPRTRGPRAALAGIPAASLQFQMEYQLQNNWCWAAVSRSVSAYDDPATGWTQCTIVNAEFDRDNCCGAGGNALDCDQPWYLNLALGRVGRLRAMIGHPLEFEQVQAEIGSARPLGIRIGWSGGGGHFIAAIGWSVTATGQRLVTICDPIYGVSELTFEALNLRYRGAGAWTHSYLTGDPPADKHGLRAMHDPMAIGGRAWQ